jgi:hypothetical protein
MASTNLRSAAPHRVHRLDSGRGRYSARPTKATTPSEPRAEDIFVMPTPAEMIAAGYPKERWNEVEQERSRLLHRYRTDPVFRDEAIERWTNHRR